MKRLHLFFLVLLVFLSFNGISQNSKEKLKKINGISFVSSRVAINEKHTMQIKKVSASHVALIPFGFIKKLNSPEVKYNSSGQWYGETKIGMEQYIREFKKVDISIMMKPQIWVWHGEYTGKIYMQSQANWKILEDSYLNFILEYAKLAQELKVEIFCIGTELEQFVANRPEYWYHLISEVKKVYKGKLTYAANWDEFKRVYFWKQLDFIGIDAYFPLTDKKTPSVNDFELGWKLPKKQIKTIQQRYNRPILFTEYGYRSINYTGKEPWDSNHVIGKVNLEAQKNATQAIYNQFWNEDWFAGGFLWKWFHNHDKVGGENDNRFTPQNKPTEKLIQQLYAN